MSKATQEAARNYLLRGWAPIPLHPGKKTPIGKGWQNLRLTAEDIPKAFRNGRNIGLLPGAPSLGLGDVDLDTLEAIRAAPYLLPPTDMIHGRPGAPRSHRWYEADPIPETMKCKDPTVEKDDDEKGMLVELRSTGGQTVVPPSTHEETGEAITWESDGDPAKVDGDELARAVRKVAAAALLARHWVKGSRHESALALSGALLNAWGVDKLEEVERFMEAVCEAAEDEEKRSRIGDVRSTAEKLEAGEDVTGLPTLADMLGEKVVDKVAEWLGLGRYSEKRRVIKPWDPMSVAERMLEELFTEDGCRTLHYFREEFFERKGGSYAVASNQKIRSALWHFMADSYKPGKDGIILPCEPTKAQVSGAMDALRAATYVVHDGGPPFWLPGAGEDAPPAEEIVPMANGLLHLPTRELHPHTPLFFSLDSRPYPYDPDAGEPVELLRFLESLWPDDPESQETVQEAAGYLVSGDTRLQKGFQLIGPTRSGKSTLASTFREIVGEENSAAMTLNALSKDFGLQGLLNANLAVFGDVRLSRSTDQGVVVERLLSIIGEDPVLVDRKWKQPLSVRLPTRIVMLSNEAMALTDASGAVTNRFIPLKLTKSFLGREDTGILDRIKGEMPAVFNWALDGLDRLRERGHFRIPEASKGLHAQLQDLASPIGQFVRENCFLHAEAKIKKDLLYSYYAAWARAHGHGVKSRNMFGKDLFAAFATVDDSRPRNPDASPDNDEPHKISMYTGIDLTDEARANWPGDDSEKDETEGDATAYEKAREATPEDPGEF